MPFWDDFIKMMLVYLDTFRNIVWCLSGILLLYNIYYLNDSSIYTQGIRHVVYMRPCVDGLLILSFSRIFSSFESRDKWKNDT